MKKQSRRIRNNEKYEHKQHHSAGRFRTSSSAGTIMLLILFLIANFIISSLFNLLTGNDTSAIGSVSLSVSSNVVNLSVAPTRATGTFAKSDNVNISASTNNSTGYTLMLAASSSTDYNKLKNGSDYLTSISSATTEEAFKSLSGTAYNNKWGYLPSKYCSSNTNNTSSTSITTCSTNTDFLPAPTTSGDILDKTESANTNNTANNYTLAIGARVDSTTKMGSYTNTYNVILVANEVPYTIAYYDSIIDNMPVDVSSASSAETVNISNNTPTRDGYTFLGWCTMQPTTTNGTDTCTGTEYAPGDSWTLGASDNDLHLYAMWQKNDFCDTHTCMQDFTKAMCQSQASSNSITVYDSRDEKDYSVRYVNGNCWMTQDLEFLFGERTITSADSDVASSYTIPATYTRCGASAGTTCNSGTMTASICPKGWTIPTLDQGSTITGTSYIGALNFTANKRIQTKNTSSGSGGTIYMGVIWNLNGSIHISSGSDFVASLNESISVRCVRSS